MAKDGTISPPFSPAPSVRAVSRSFQTKSRGWALPSRIAPAIMSEPVPR